MFILGKNYRYISELSIIYLSQSKAKVLGYQFTELKDWIYELLDYYIQVVEDMDKVVDK